jgi:hypothetical protein
MMLSRPPAPNIARERPGHYFKERFWLKGFRKECVET